MTTVPNWLSVRSLVCVSLAVSPRLCRLAVAASGVDPSTFGTVTGGETGWQTPMETVVFRPAWLPPRGFWLTTMLSLAAGQCVTVVAAGIRPAPRKMLVAWSCVCRVTSGTVTVTGCTGVTGTTGDTGVVGVDEAGEAEAELLAREAELPGLEMTDDGPVVGGAGPGPPRRTAAIAIAEAVPAAGMELDRTALPDGCKNCPC